MKQIILFFIFTGLQAGWTQQLLPAVEIKADVQGLKQVERTLVQLIVQARKCVEDTCIREKNEAFKAFLEEQSEVYAVKWMDFAFDKLKKYVSILRTEDRQYRIFTWNLQRKNREHVFFGYIFSENKKKIKRESLKSIGLDKKLILSKLVQQPLTAKNWYGALYQAVITRSIGKKKYYILLGWDGMHDRVYRKIIDVMQADGRGDLQFGAPIFFITPKLKQHRVVVEYMPKAAYFLAYQPALEALQMDHIQSYVEQVDLPFFKVPTGVFDLFVWQQKGFYFLENFSGNQQEWPAKISKELRKKFLHTFIPVADHTPANKKQLLSR